MFLRCPALRFLLTRPSRGATVWASACVELYTDFYSHAPRGARLLQGERNHAGVQISTHTPLAGRDDGDGFTGPDGDNFYSHAPRGARQR